MPFAHTIAIARRHASIMAAAAALSRARRHAERTRLAEQTQAERTRSAKQTQAAEQTQLARTPPLQGEGRSAFAKAMARPPAEAQRRRAPPSRETKPTEKIQ